MIAERLRHVVADAASAADGVWATWASGINGRQWTSSALRRRGRRGWKKAEIRDSLGQWSPHKLPQDEGPARFLK
jgi:hypothetical protein